MALGLRDYRLSKAFKRALFGLIRRDGYVAWARERTLEGLRDLLVTWFGPPTVASGNM
ncbi:aromatic-ring hydroxylase C-terminal domain-containing protein [Bradyrhizobium japonicum]|uniref:aromatic-ring hydroxylase C-terminal domain-containing protein n=1 Tax=Bradyrhizobium japonicum TaxID=375 RepID=UPI003221C7A5